jgi:quinol monooxygenase YgiN
MLTIKEMDPCVGIRDQLAEASDEPVVLINTFNAAPEDVEPALAAWTEDARYFKAQPGFISTQLHRGLAGSGVFLNYAVWQSVAHFRAAFTNPAFHAHMKAYPDGVVAAPHLFRKLAGSRICVA